MNNGLISGLYPNVLAYLVDLGITNILEKFSSTLSSHFVNVSPLFVVSFIAKDI